MGQMSHNPFGVHFIPVHQGQQHYDFIAAAKPAVVKLVSGNGAPDVQMMATMYACAPDAIHVYRNHPLSEQHDDLWRDPIGTAVRHVSNWQNELRARRDEAARRGLALPPMEQTMTLGVNEPIIELFARQEDMSNYADWLAMMQQRTPILDDYMATYVWESLKYSQPCPVGNFSGGQPANLKPGEYATYDWFPKTRRALEANRGRAALAVHEYWDVPGPGEMVDWWTYRFFHCDWDTDIYVLECGIDRQIRGVPYDGNRGWFGHMTAQQYAGQVGEYIRHCRQDSRFVAATPFTLDGDEMWWSFWIDNCMPEMLALSDQLRDETQPAQGGHTTHLPQVGNGPQTPTAEPPQPQPEAPGDLFPRAYAFTARWEGGWSDHPDDPGGATMRGITLGTFAAWRKANGYGVPTKDDLRAIRDDEVQAIYRAWYWAASGADELRWPMALVQFDTSVLHGTGQARQWLRDSGGDVLRYLALRLRSYTAMDHWHVFGAGWTRRVADLLEEAA